jgi:hypothetical protein
MKNIAHKIWREWLRPFALVALIASPFKSAIADWNWVPTGSMKPSIRRRRTGFRKQTRLRPEGAVHHRASVDLG